MNLCLLKEEKKKRVLRDLRIFFNNTLKPRFKIFIKFANIDIEFDSITELIQILNEKSLIGEVNNDKF